MLPLVLMIGLGLCFAMIFSFCKNRTHHHNKLDVDKHFDKIADTLEFLMQRIEVIYFKTGDYNISPSHLRNNVSQILFVMSQLTKETVSVGQICDKEEVLTKLDNLLEMASYYEIPINEHSMVSDWNEQIIFPHQYEHERQRLLERNEHSNQR